MESNCLLYVLYRKNNNCRPKKVHQNNVIFICNEFETQTKDFASIERKPHKIYVDVKYAKQCFPLVLRMIFTSYSYINNVDLAINIIYVKKKH